MSARLRTVTPTTAASATLVHPRQARNAIPTVRLIANSGCQTGVRLVSDTRQLVTSSPSYYARAIMWRHESLTPEPDRGRFRQPIVSKRGADLSGARLPDARPPLDGGRTPRRRGLLVA